MYRNVFRRLTGRRLSEFERRNLRSCRPAAPVHTAALGAHPGRRPGAFR
ncbi:hypothetical protein B7C42_03059 [Nocardia cerradoensis]|uniref:Uncharacterized protein n=1 Tax=Nocardia cerradoensis TaxID=85688 RepID=A0A231H8K2_9NOCA|nr:hypothetical protein [Nocardia cerradoensis]OXR45102.1 hypothetical protein B7C42_03059 [Nocardia cerradoensis]